MSDPSKPPGKPATGNWQSEPQTEASIYQAAFESVDEGVCLLDVLFDADGRAVDYRVLATNPAFEKQTGLAGAVGKTARELVPALEDHWPEIYGTVATTGQSIRFEQRSDAVGAWFDVFASRVGDPGSHLVAAVFKDVSERRAALDAVQASEARYRQLADALPQLVWTAL